MSGILSADGTAEKEKVFQWLHEGFTIILNSYERQSAGVLRLRHLAEQLFHSRVQANVYLTPRESQGFTPHWDNHDVFILQFEGSKLWSVYDRVNPPPTKKQLFDGVWTPVEPSLSVTLRPGDILYIPKGYVHEARTTDHLSGHVTLGIMPYTYGDLLREALSDIDESPEFRDALPPRFGEVECDDFAARLDRYVGRLDVDAARRRLFARYCDTRLPDSSQRLMDYVRLPALNNETSLRRRNAIFYQVTYSHDGVVLRFNNKSIRLPPATAGAIREILKRESLTPQMLGLDDASNRLLAETLVREGFLTILSDATAGPPRSA